MILQSNFTLGEISPLLYSRVDYDGYYKGAKRLRNVLVLPQGSITRRFGTRFVGEIINITSYDQAKFVVLQYFDDDIYLIIFKPLVIEIYYNDLMVASVVSTYSLAQIKDLNFTQDANSLWIFHADQRPAKLQRVSPHASWALNQQFFKNPPVYDFTQNYDSINFTPSGTSGTVTITASAAIFSAAYVEGLFFGNSGTVRIDTFTDSTHVTGHTLTDFNNPNAISGKDAFLAEPAISAARGWPKSGTFFQDRLVFGGAKSLPEGVLISSIGQHLDFDTGTGLDSDGISIFIRSDKANVIKHVLHTSNLIMFTSSGIYSSPPFTDKPATPKDFYMPEQSKNGIAEASPVAIDNQIIFVDRGGKIVRSLVYSVERSGYVGNNISITAPHLIRNPISAAAFENPEVYDGQYLLLANEDGTLAVYQSLAAQNVSAWSLSETDGKFRALASSNSNVYFIVERTVSGQTRFFIEKLDFSVYTDNTIDFTFEGPITEITGLGHLEGFTVYVTADDYIAGEFTVLGGKIILENPATHVSIGLPYTPEIVPLPVNIELPDGHTLYKNKSVSSLYIDYLDSRGVYVNDFLIPMEPLTEIDAPPSPQTGIYIYSPMQGWDPTEEIVITQVQPLPMTIRAIAREMN
jgi:hypothetical protein